MPTIRLSVFARSDVGRVRKSNEDAFTVTDLDTGARVDDETGMAEVDVRDRGVLMVVSDGMGGHAAGEVASALVVDSLRGKLGASDGKEATEHLIEQAVRHANENVLEAARDAEKEGMGATLTAVLVHKRLAYIAEVGDSRAYLLRGKRLRQMTKDQSFVQVLLDSGAITSEQAKTFANKNWILQAMGSGPDVAVSIGRLQLRRGDRLLLCSDGLHGLVEDEELGRLLAGDDLVVVCNRMIDRANEKGGDDNITAIVAELDGDGLPDLDYDETVTQTFEVLKEFKGMPSKDPSHPSEAQADRGADFDDGDDDDKDDDDGGENERDAGGDATPAALDPLPSQTPTLRPPAPRSATEDLEKSGRESIVALGVVALVLTFVVLGYLFTR